MTAKNASNGAADQAIVDYMTQVGQRARQGSRALAKADVHTKAAALEAIARRIDIDRVALQQANAKDLTAARSNQLAQPLQDRLVLDDAAIDQVIEGVRQVNRLPDPVGEITDMAYRPTGIQVGKMRVPLGVIGIIYESRPNVTADAASLCLKSGNACVLRGGSEAIHSNLALAQCITDALAEVGLPGDCVQLVNTTDRAAVGALLRLDDYVDVIIPRGGRGLIERVSTETRIPVIKHLDGICHVFIDSSADVDMAVALSVNSKTSKYAVCNAVETLLIHEDIAAAVIPPLASEFAQAGVEIRGCANTRKYWQQAKQASEQDWHAEFLAPILAVKTVADLDEAIAHINHYGSAHTDAFVGNDYAKSKRFLTEVDSASVLINASTQFADGFEFGLGAEIGISTDKLHARGPVGLEGLTSQKFIVLGSGEIRVR